MDFLSAAAASLALTAGALAAVNPCGFALLPAYLTVIVTGTADAKIGRRVALGRALLFGTAMTLGFILVFGTFGGLLSPFHQAIFPYLGWVTVVIGLGLLVLGIALLRGGELRGPGLAFAGRAPQGTFLSQIVYGASFALVSLSCTIGPFLTVFATSLQSNNYFGVISAFVLYGVGMGAVIVTLSLIAALAGTGAVARVRRATPVLKRIGGALLIAAALYVLYYGWFELRLRYGSVSGQDAVISAGAELQGSLVRWLDAIPAWGFAALAAVVVVIAIVIFRKRRTVS